MYCIVVPTGFVNGMPAVGGSAGFNVNGRSIFYFCTWRTRAAGGVEFVPFSIEAGGVWGPAAQKFFRECLALADDDRDIDLYHWSSTRFSAVWRDTLSVLVARGRAQVSVAAAVADWPKRIRDMRYVDHEDYGGTD